MAFLNFEQNIEGDQAISVEQVEPMQLIEFNEHNNNMLMDDKAQILKIETDILADDILVSKDNCIENITQGSDLLKSDIVI